MMIQWGYSGDTVRIQREDTVRIQRNTVSIQKDTVGLQRDTMRIQLGNCKHNVRDTVGIEGGYNVDIVRIQWGYNEDTAGIQ